MKHTWRKESAIAELRLCKGESPAVRGATATEATVFSGYSCMGRGRGRYIYSHVADVTVVAYMLHTGAGLVEQVINGRKVEGKGGAGPHSKHNVQRVLLLRTRGRDR
jgi:hypothetical protein